MTNAEAIEFLELIRTDGGTINEALGMAISALKKLIPERPKRIITNKEVSGNFQMVCPSCGWLMFERVTTKDKSEPVVYRICNFCQSCGQRIDRGKS